MEETRYGLSVGPEPNPKHLLRGKDEILGKAGAIMSELGKMLRIDGKNSGSQSNVTRSRDCLR